MHPGRCVFGEDREWDGWAPCCLRLKGGICSCLRLLEGGLDSFRIGGTIRRGVARKVVPTGGYVKLSFMLVLALFVSLGSAEPGPTRISPTDDPPDTLHYDAAPDRGVLINGTYTYGAGVRFTADVNLTVKTVLYYLTGNADAIWVSVNGAGTQAEPGPMLDSVRSTGSGGRVWREAVLPNPPDVAAGTDFWTVVIVRRHPPEEHPLTLDLGPMTPWRGGFITLPSIGPDWYQLTDPPFWTDRNWNVRAVVEYQTGVEEELLPSGPVAERRPVPTVVCGVLRLPASAQATLADAGGRMVAKLVPGENDISHLRSGVYFVREEGSRTQGFEGSSRKVVIQR